MNLVFSIALIHLAACLSPGPDIFLVVRTSIRHGWRTALATTMGILSGVSLQIILGLTGISYLLSNQPGLHAAIALAGATWLLYLGISGLRGCVRTAAISPEGSGATAALLTSQRAWSEGFLINILNPKALLYFLSLFSVLLGPEVPVRLRIVSGLTIIIVQAIAFSMAAILVARPFFTAHWGTLQRWLDAGISLILTGLGLWIWLKTLTSLLA